LKTLVAMLVCLAVIGVSIALLVYLPSSESSDSSAAVPKIKAGTVILAQSGATGATSNSFTIGDKWDLVWRFDCSNVPFRTGDFVVRLFNGTSANRSIDYVNRDVHRAGQAGADIEHYTAGDSHKKLLVIETNCRWGVIVQGA
jgi:hypothetical protein